MSLSRAEQVERIISKKNNLLVTFDKNASGDAISSAVALASFFEKMNKRVEIVADNFSLPNKFSFLENAEKIKSNFKELQKFIISTKLDGRGLKNISYEIQEDQLRIFVTPKEGTLDKKDLQGVKTEFKYDLIFTVDTQSLSSLGNIYHQHTDLFFDTPIINIDHNNDNEHFGHINFVDITSTSTSELVHHLIESIAPEYLQKELATALLTGIISKTRSFKSENVAPSTLEKASKLMNLGADRDHIIENLYRTRSVSELKLWGQALAHLQKDEDVGLVWTTLTREDFSRSGTNQDDIYEIIEELIQNSPEAKLILLLYEHPEQKGKIEGILTVGKVHNAKQILKPLSPQGSKNQAFFSVEHNSLKKVEDKITSRIKKVVSNRYKYK